MARHAPSIDAYGDGGFRLDGERREGSLLILSDEARTWSVGALSELTPESLAPVLEAGRVEVEFLLLGVGARNAMPPRGRADRHLRLRPQLFAPDKSSYTGLSRKGFEGGSMSGLLANLRNTVIVSFILALIIVAGYFMHYGSADGIFWQAVFRWLHVLFGIMWIGLLYYFNFVQIPTMPKIPAELKPGVSKFIAPEALFWFRWAALFTWVMGVLLAVDRGYFVQAVTLGAMEGFQTPAHSFIGLGMWLATIMFFNVWAFIWPAQKIALGLVEADADAKAAAARKAMLFSRTNTLLSIPMLVTMTMNQTIFG